MPRKMTLDEAQKEWELAMQLFNTWEEASSFLVDIEITVIATHSSFILKCPKTKRMVSTEFCSKYCKDKCAVLYKP